MDIIDETVHKIKNLEIQGATNIVNSALSALKTWLSKNPNTSLADFKSKSDLLKSARPTEPFLQNVLTSLTRINEVKGMGNAVTAIEEMETKIRDIGEKIINNGYELLKEKSIFLTHCHASTVEQILVKIHHHNPALKVYSTETRPLFQGRITARNLADAGVKVISIVDSSAADIVADKPKYGVEALIIGADAILPDGSVINKVGSHGIALAAYTYGIPVYVCASLQKSAPGNVSLEERDPREIWPDAPSAVKIMNPAFDKVPAEYITGIITEAGVLESRQIAEKVKELYPGILDCTNDLVH